MSIETGVPQLSLASAPFRLRWLLYCRRGVAGDSGMPSPQHTYAVAVHVCSSKTMKFRNSSHFTVFGLTV